MSGNILVIEDDASINDIVCTRLRQDGHEVTAAFSGTEAELRLDGFEFDLIITDLMLPGISGEDVVRNIRQKTPNLPIIVLSARASSADKVELLTLGADDYLSKPFDIDELSARVNVQLRRKSISSVCDSDIIVFGAWRIDPSCRTLTVGSEMIALTRTEYNIAELLATSPGQVFTKQQIFEHAWDEPYMGQESTVSAHVSNLRSKLKHTFTDEYIQTVWGIGFRLYMPE